MKRNIIKKLVGTIGDEVFWILESDAVRMEYLVEENMEDVSSRKIVSWYEVTNIRELRFLAVGIPGEEKCELVMLKSDGSDQWERMDE